MPTFTALALDRLIESGASKSMTTAKNVPDYKQERRNTTPSTTSERFSNSKHERRNSSSTLTTIDKMHHWAPITPALYATPETKPLPDSPSSFPPSPYIINHKRRGPRLLKSSSDDDVASCKQTLDGEKVTENGENEEKGAFDLAKGDNSTFTSPNSVEVKLVNGTVDRELGARSFDNSLVEKNGLFVGNGTMEPAGFNSEGGELDDFFDPQDAMSAKSNTEGEGSSGVERSLYHSTPMAEFYDAWEELSSESGPQPPPRDVEAELRELRLSLLMEIEKRKQAEEFLDDMRSQWLRIREQLALVGLTLPTDPVDTTDPAEELSSQVYLARFVSNSIGRGIGKAEVELEMETQIESKNFEIARLCDRLQYYEAVNREMSQRNQEVIETARRLRQRRKRRQSWVWGSVAVAITLGTSALAWSYMSTGRGLSSVNESHSSEHDPTAK